MTSISPVRKTVVVQTTVSKAFEVFTVGIDRWWPKFASLGDTPIVESVFEPFPGGRWYSKHEDGGELVRGHVRVLQPPNYLVLTWEVSAEFKPDPRQELSSDVAVRFVQETADATRVDLEHRNFDRMGASAGEIMRSRVDSGWSKMLEFFAKAVSGGSNGPDRG